MNTNITYHDYETGKVVEDGKCQTARTPEYIDHSILRVEDSAESLKLLADNIITSSKMLDADIDCIKRFLFNPSANTNQKESPEPRCLVDSLRQALEVIESCRDACNYIKERLG